MSYRYSSYVFRFNSLLHNYSLFILSCLISLNINFTLFVCIQRIERLKLKAKHTKRSGNDTYCVIYWFQSENKPLSFHTQRIILTQRRHRQTYILVVRSLGNERTYIFFFASIILIFQLQSLYMFAVDCYNTNWIWLSYSS